MYVCDVGALHIVRRVQEGCFRQGLTSHFSQCPIILPTCLCMYVCYVMLCNVPVPGGVEVALLHLSARVGSDRLADELSECAL